MNLHVFNDAHGFFLNLTVERFKENNALENSLFINLTNKTTYTHNKVTYLKRNLVSFKHAVKRLPVIDTVTFYPLDFSAALFLKQLKKKYPAIQTRWVFWGYEYYHRPAMNATNFDAFSTAYYKKQAGFFQQVKNTCTTIIKKILLVPVPDEIFVEESYLFVNRFYSFLPQDFKNVFAAKKDIQCKYYPISFLSIEEMTQNISWGNITGEVMVGHAASPSSNHAEILDKLKAISFVGKLFFPLEYGEDAYRIAIKNKIDQLFPCNTIVLETRLAMQAYYQRLSNVGFAIFNFRWQEALGNIVFLTWNGAKIFLKKESSVYLQFITWDLIVFSVEDDLNEKNINGLLSLEERQKNKTIIEQLFAQSMVQQYWASLMKE